MRGQAGQTWRFRARRYYNQLLNLLYPEARKTCVLCHRPGTLEDLWETLGIDEANASFLGVCLLCFQELMKVPPLERVRFLRTPDALNNQHLTPVVAAFRYVGVMPNLIRSWKYDGVTELTNWFAHSMNKRFETFLATDSKVDALVPVPTSPDRYKKRGYHQALLLAQAISKLSGIPILDCLVRRGGEGTSSQGFTQSQTAKNARERLLSLQDAYRVREGGDLKGKRIAIVDDVVTTGATLYICANALYQAGAPYVTGLAISSIELRRH